MNNGFLRRLAIESARLGADLPHLLTFLAAGYSVRERYAPMLRLLAPDDALFLIRQGLRKSVTQLRREHRSCYFGYVGRLTQEIRTARRLWTLAMASQEHWSFWVLLAHTLLSETLLLYLRWLGCRHALGINAGLRDVEECLDFLLAEPKFRPVTT
jgi:hypothetical protein